jgi:hypothetical protein
MSEYICDELVSSRIKWDNENVYVTYFTEKDIKIPFWSFSNKFDKLNKKNKELWEEASSVAKHKKLKPIMAPIQYFRG